MFTEAVYKQISFDGQEYGIWLDPQNTFIDEEIFLHGVYEPEILQLHKKYIKKGDTYIDIGANIGDTSLFVATLVGDTGRVICFEPIAHLAKQIEKSAQANKFNHVTVIQKAIAKTKGETVIYKNPTDIGASSIIDMGITAEKETIQTTDGYELDSLNKIDCIKIDVEGYEWIVMQAIAQYIERDKPKIIFEYTPGLYGEGKVEIIQYLDTVGYQLFDIEKNLIRIAEPISWAKTFNRKQTNILCLPR